MSEASSSTRPGSPIGELPTIPSARPFRFTWDAANRKPGPGSVSEATEGPGDYHTPFTAPTGYDVYNTSVQALALGAFPPEWSSSTHGFHAISTVVNNPHKRSAPPKAHSSIPAVPPADLPRVRRKDFDAYLRSVAPEWERFEKNAEQGRDGVAQIDSSASQSHLQASPGSSTLDDVPQTPKTPRAPVWKPLTPLETVPDIYFDPKFNLGDPKTFDAVTGREGSLDFSDPLAPSNYQPLSDMFSRHADTIEQHLLREISLRSTSFFAALSNLQDLQSESEQCLERIGNLRESLKQVDEKGARKGLEIVRLESKLRNVAQVREGIKVVGGVVEMTGVARSLVAAGQWGQALDVIEGLNSLWGADESVLGDTDNQDQAVETRKKAGLPTVLETVVESPPETPTTATPTPMTLTATTPIAPTVRKPEPPVPLSALKAFGSLPEHLQELTLEITTSLTSEVVNVLRVDLMERIDMDPESSADSPPGGVQMSLKDRLRPMLHSLVRTNGVRDAAISWKEVVLLEVNSILKRRIPSFDIGDEDVQSAAPSSIINELKEKDHLSFMELARTMFRSFLNCIEGLQAQNTIIVEVLEAIRYPKSPIDIPAIREDLADVLSSAGELANVRASKVVNVRTEQHTALDLPAFWTLFNVSWDFVVRSEVICKRMIVALRGVLVSQAFHQARLSQSAKLVEDEQWNPAEVSPAVQRIVDMLVESSIRDPRDLLLNPPPLNPGSPLPPTSPLLSPAFPGDRHRPSSPMPSPAPNRTSVNINGTRKSTSSPGKYLKIEERNYFAVSATLEVLILLVDYLKLIMNLPMLTTDTMSRVIELMKAFNSRTCQVVLGAGAMRSAGLKNITAKHLALASQSLSVMISLIPYIRETFRRHLSQKQAVMLVEFDKLKRDYQEHQNEIHAKLIAIMGDRLTAHIRTLQGIRWDVAPQESGVNNYMELLVKETVTLHKVLSRYLSPSIVEYVMTQVFAAINHRLSEEYTKIELPSQEAKDRLLADARYLHSKLTGLKHVGAPTAMLEIVVSEKSIARKVAPPPPTPATPSSRFKGMLARADSLHLRKNTAPKQHQEQPAMPPVPEHEKEKVLPLPGSTSPLPVVSVTPSPIPSDTKSPPISSPDPTAVSLPSSPKPPAALGQDINATITDNGNATTTNTGVVVPSDPQPTSGLVHSEGVNGSLGHEVGDLEGVTPSVRHFVQKDELPPPPTPDKISDSNDGVTVVNGVVVSSVVGGEAVEQ